MAAAPVHVMVVFGTRPEAIKMAPVVRALQAEPLTRVTTVVTGQHREMLDQVNGLFGIVPDRDLDVMTHDQTLFEITSRTLSGMEQVLREVRPDLVLVQGDTTSAFAAGLAAFYQRIPVGHVEAGLRTDDRYDPFPEEMNRRLLTRIASLQLAPTVRAAERLRAEGVPSEDVFLTGNTVTDALQHILSRLPPGLPEGLVEIPPGSQVLLVETHRRENLGDPMKEICEALQNLVKKFTSTFLVFSVHRNPRVREVVIPALQGCERVALLDPVDYPVLVRLMRESYLILTDSGGIQEEAPSLGKPVLVLRRTTERPEGIESGNARLVGTDRERVFREAAELLEGSEGYARMCRAANPYGDGRAAERTVQAILHRFGRADRRPDDFIYGHGSGNGRGAP